MSKEKMIEKLFRIATMVANGEFKERYFFKAVIAWNDKHEDDEIFASEIDEGIALEDYMIYFER